MGGSYNGPLSRGSAGLGQDVVQVAAATRQPVKARHHNGVTGVEGLHQATKLWTAANRFAAALFAKDTLATGRLQHLDLEIVILPGGAHYLVTTFMAIPLLLK
jgi:hypothetical protein